MPPQANSPSKGKMPLTQSPPTQTLAIIFWMSVWFAASIVYVFSVSIILRSLPDNTLMVDMHALAISQTTMNTFISAMIYLFIGRRVSLTNNNNLNSNNNNHNSANIHMNKEVELSISKGKMKEISNETNSSLSKNSTKITTNTISSSTNTGSTSSTTSTSTTKRHIQHNTSNNIDNNNNNNSISSLKKENRKENNSPLLQIDTILMEEGKKKNSLTEDMNNNHNILIKNDIDLNNHNNHNDDDDNNGKKIPLSDLRYIDSLLTCTCCSGLKTWKKRTFHSDMLIIFVGLLRIAVHLAGLSLLKYAEVSFAEAIKSTSPIFTVLFAYVILGEKASTMIQCSLIPVVAGLMLAAGSEGASSMAGLLSGLLTVSLESIVNVFCKPLCAIYGGYETQFFTSVWSTLVAILSIPIAFNSSLFITASYDRFILILLCTVAYHLQWSCQFIVMELVTPVSLSVANVLKRGTMILVSLWYFRNPVTLPSGLGILVMFFGLVTYTAMKRHEASALSSSLQTTHHVSEKV